MSRKTLRNLVPVGLWLGLLLVAAQVAAEPICELDCNENSPCDQRCRIQGTLSYSSCALYVCDEPQLPPPGAASGRPPAGAWPPSAGLGGEVTALEAASPGSPRLADAPGQGPAAACSPADPAGRLIAAPLDGHAARVGPGLAGRRR